MDPTTNAIPASLVRNIAQRLASPEYTDNEKAQLKEALIEYIAVSAEKEATNKEALGDALWAEIHPLALKMRAEMAQALRDLTAAHKPLIQEEIEKSNRSTN